MRRLLDVAGRNIEVAEIGAGEPVLYLHGLADIHGARPDWLRFHESLGQDFRVIAPAHPGCGESQEDDAAETIDDLVFHYLEVIDALGLSDFHLVGSSVGGWIAAEIAVRHREKVRTLALLGATGLFVPGAPIGDLFMMVQAETGTRYEGLRHMLFRSADAAEAHAIYPDGRMTVELETRRYRAFRFASRFGFAPPYFYNAKLKPRLSRFDRPALVVAGESDNFVPRPHADTYVAGFPNAQLHLLAGAGHSIVVERGDEVAALLTGFLRQPDKLARSAIPIEPSRRSGSSA
jgi:pimeloyl-ACP methyl ester carboxylesterase